MNKLGRPTDIAPKMATSIPTIKPSQKIPSQSESINNIGQYIPQPRIPSPKITATPRARIAFMVFLSWFMIRVNKLILPLLVSILLSTVGTLKIGRDVNALFGVVFSPITTPTAMARSTLTGSLEFLEDLPRMSLENQELKKEYSALLSENQNLKDAITDQETLKNSSKIFTSTIPIRVISIGKTVTATTSFSTESIKRGQPVVSGTILLGFVDRVSDPIIHIIPLDSESLSRFPVKTGMGQSGIYLFESRTPQIADLPSENPVNLNDSILTLPTELIPANLVLGRTTKIISAPQSPLQKAEIKLDSKLTSKTPDPVIVTQP
ncbi:MAG: hypothetical protein UW23_C0015G0005 [Candidatus Collierbacteria bacterium GW2011_GWA1_44_12]|uniref:Rod shape-determining protein MreC beta-barrel core domain-containing protein n=4 Tax=Candidatus Collieribacteriota TaxID=1752725 RepID=A0A0G1GM93_9BACT|nr:MAG: hypothetical protein UW23_C0015G0005 [Candidatus Collierbacteria bacterium GW2011_GWA1_44_12]